VEAEAARPSLFYPHIGRRSGRPIDQPVSVAFRSGRVIDALNAVIIARRQGAEWQFGYGGYKEMLTDEDSEKRDGLERRRKAFAVLADALNRCRDEDVRSPVVTAALDALAAGASES
jgi:hypothetical protein